MIDSPLPPNRCPADLVPVMLDVIATNIEPRTISSPVASEPTVRGRVDRAGLHEKTVILQDEEYDHLMMLFANTIGTSFFCHDSHKGMDYNLSFAQEPEVLKLELASNSKQYTVRVQLVLVSPSIG